MKKYSNPNGDILVLERGEELFTVLENYAKENGLKGAWLQSGVGGSAGATVSFYDLSSREYVDKIFDEPLEIISLQGNLAWIDEEPFWHVHGVLGTSEYQAIGGHIKSLKIALTGELLIVPLGTQMGREYDETTGLKLLN